MAGERYFLRTLLTKIKGVTSFESLRNVNGRMYNTFKEACVALGLFDSDEEWDACLREAAGMQSRSKLRNLFASILIFMDPKDSLVLWESHKSSIVDDCKHRLQLKGFVNPTNEEVESFGLHLLNDLLLNFGKSLQYFNLPLPQIPLNRLETNRLIETQLDYDREGLASIVEQEALTLNEDQRLIYDAIMDAYSREEARVFFIDGPGGTGKTYVENLILKSIRANGHIALAVASSGIAALLLDGGRTPHSTFKIPLRPDTTSVCNISKKTHLHELLKRTRLILWDEAPMTNKFAFEALDRTLRDLLSRDVLFGGILSVMFGDFRQILPIVPKGTCGDIVCALLKNSFLWTHIEKFNLRQNMRTREACYTLDKFDGVDFGAWLLKLGNNELQTFDDEWVVCPRMMRLENQTSRGLIDEIYPRLEFGEISKEVLAQRAILATKNDHVNSMNEEILTLLPGQAHSYLSADTTQDSEAQEQLPIEFLNSLELSSLPSHCLNLKVGAPVILLRNLDPLQGLYNGTRLIVLQLGLHIIQAEILMGQAAGSVILIPRIHLLSKQHGLPFV